MCIVGLPMSRLVIDVKQHQRVGLELHPHTQQESEKIRGYFPNATALRFLRVGFSGFAFVVFGREKASASVGYIQVRVG